MEVHANAKLAPRGRLTMVRRLQSAEIDLTGAAESFGISTKTAAKWRERYRAEGEAPPNRYEKKDPGELIHIDVKKLGRIGHNGPAPTAKPKDSSAQIGKDHTAPSAKSHPEPD